MASPAEGWASSCACPISGYGLPCPISGYGLRPFLIVQSLLCPSPAYPTPTTVRRSPGGTEAWYSQESNKGAPQQGLTALQLLAALVQVLPGATAPRRFLADPPGLARSCHGAGRRRESGSAQAAGTCTGRTGGQTRLAWKRSSGYR